MNIKNSKVKADFGRFKIITINIQPDYLITLEVTLEDKVEHITDILNHEMKTSLKFYISAYVTLLHQHTHFNLLEALKVKMLEISLQMDITRS